MKLYVLGSGGWIPTPQRHTCTYLLECKNELILMDTGSGLSRLGDYIHILERYKTINIIYSHYHLDHVLGLTYLPNWLKEVSGKKR